MHIFEATPAMEPMLAELENGQPLEIRRGSVPVAIVFPAQSNRNPDDIRQAIEGLKQLRQGLTLGGSRMRDLIDEGRP